MTLVVFSHSTIHHSYKNIPIRHFRRKRNKKHPRRHSRRIRNKTPQPVILAGRRGSSYGYVVTRSVTQPL